MGFVRRRARRRTMLVAGGLAYEAGKNRGGGEDYEATPQDDSGYQDVPPAPPPPAPTEPSETDELQRLAELHDNGTLSDEEFSAAKAKLLGI